MLIESNDWTLIKEFENECFGKQAYSDNVLTSMKHTHHLYFMKDAQFETPVGYVVLQKVDSNYELIRIGVLKKFRHQHYASHALQTLFKKLSYKMIMLEVSATNVVAKNLYFKNGFSVVTTRRKYYPDGSDALILAHLK